ncbi:MAG: MerR family transcriptional regulator [Actinomycetota bacterium]|nr:MerR family transcriptional regulator [Actinomycetota bacterium]
MFNNVEAMMAAEVTIGELSQRTGIRPATLRMWETRYGFPVPTRSPAGQRRYSLDTVELVLQVLGEQAEGRSLPAAIKHLRHGADVDEPSLFALLRRRRPELPVHRLRKAALIAISSAIEDECAATGPQQLLVGSFQTEHYYRDSEHRWAELARTTQATVVFADFTDPAGLSRHPMEIPFPTDHPLHREWIIIAIGPRIAACLAGWEVPGRESTADTERTFDTIWTVEREVVSHVAVAACALASRADPVIAQRLSELTLETAATDELASITAITNRMIAYLAGSAA